MESLKNFFWFSLILIIYSYIGYGLILFVLVKIKQLLSPSKACSIADNSAKPLTLVIPAYNEQDFIETKIRNTLALDYPADKLHIIFVTDGSSDETPAIIKRYTNLTLMHSRERKGKIAAMNRVMKIITTPFVVFCDANTLLNKSALKEIMKHYDDEKVGGVAGEKKVMSQDSGAGEGEGLYWKYESALKRLDSQFHTVVGAAGELFSFRTHLYQHVEEDTLLDDFVISLRICAKGYRVVYEPAAMATEAPSANMQEEQKRKIRIGAGGFQSIVRLRALLNPLRYPKLSFQYISHRVLRWAVCPFLLPLVLLANLWIALKDPSPLYISLLAAQMAFYIAAFAGWLMAQRNRRWGPLHFPYYFVFMNLSLYLGLQRYLRGNQSVMWEKAKRQG